jgi:hypothetical protein
MVFDRSYLNIEGAFVAALRTRIDARRNRPGSEFFPAKSATTVDAYVEVLKSRL